MYLISIYFDEKTNERLQQYINQVAKKTGNTFMLDGNVPPHLTISAFRTRDEKKAMELFYKVTEGMKSGSVQWVSVGVFLPYVIYLAPVLDEYLHGMSKQIYEGLVKAEDIQICPCYKPFQWMPHTTIGKKLSKEEMRIAFEVLQGQFGVLKGQVTKIGLARTNPYEDLAVVEYGKCNLSYATIL